MLCEVGDHLVHRVPVEHQEGGVVPDGVEAPFDILLTKIVVRELSYQPFHGCLLHLDSLLDFLPGPTPVHDRCCCSDHIGMFQQCKSVVLFEEVVHSANLFDQLELEQPLNVGVLRVHQHVDQLSIICSHALGIENLVSPSNLKDGGEIIRVLLKASVFDHLLADFIVRSHC